MLIAPTGQPLPTAVPLTATFPDPAGPFDQLERVEHMRVSVSSLTVSGPSAGLVDESAATGTSNGAFHGVVTGLPRPFREAGIRAPDVPPSGTIPPIPRWDANPERLRIESATIDAQPILTVKSGDVVGPLVGPLDYVSRGYTILPDGTSGTPIVTPGSLATTVSVAAADEVTVASFNLQRFFDTVDDPATSDVVLTAGAYQNRLAKASIAIRNHLRNPDIIGVQQAESLSVLVDLANRMTTDGGANYDPFLVEGNDVAGLDVGFLVKTDLVSGGQPRVSVTSVTQVGQATTWIDPDDNQPALLNDRPPLVLEATVNRTSTTGIPLVVMVNDLLSTTGIDSEAPAGLTTEGDRVRRKRHAQAELVANYVQARLTANPSAHLLVTGDFNAFNGNDGHVDMMNVIAGTPPPDNETVVPGDGVDLVNPDLVNLASTPPAAERYTHLSDGNAQALDHVLVSAPLVAATSARRIEHARIGADYPETERNDSATAFRISDHDPVVAYLAVNDLVIADLMVSLGDAPDPVAAGTELTYAITVTNSGPDAAENVSLSDTLPPGTTFVSLASPGGWSCTTPAVGAGGTVACSNPILAVGSDVFTLTVAVPISTAGGTVLSNTATVAATTTDAAPGNESSTVTTTVDGAPVISDIANQTILEDTGTGALPFTIGDVGTPAASLTVSGSSSDTTLVPNGNIVFGGSGANRTVTVTPAQDQHGGPATITVTVSDGTLSATDTFTVTVNAANEPPTLTGLADATIQETKTVTQTLTISADGTAVETLTVTAASSNDALLPDGAAVVTGTGTTRTLTLTPIAEQIGETLVTVTVSDGELTTTRTARLVVTAAPPPDAPSGLVGTVLGNVVAFTWTAPAAGATPTFYVLEGGTAPGATTLPVINTGTQSTQWTVTLPASAYFFRVRAANRAGISGRSNEGPVVVSAAAQLPGPPSALLTTVTGAQVTVQWAPNTVGGAPSQWQIELGSAPGARDLGTFHVPSQLTIVSGSLDAGEYLLRVRGVNAAGEGPPSNEVRVHVGGIPACEVPEPPVLLPATVVDRLVQLAWRGSRNTPVANYRVLVGSQPGVVDLHAIDVGSVNVLAGLAEPRQYLVWVVGMNDCGVSQPSNTIRVDVGPGPPAPANLRAVVDEARVSLAWDAVPGVDGYVLEAGTAPDVTDLASIPTVTSGYIVADGVAPGTYYVRVRAVRAGAVSGPSGAIAIVVP